MGHRWPSTSTDVWDAYRVEATEAGRRQSSKVRRAGKRGTRRADGTSGGVGGKNSRHKKGKVCQQMEAVSPEGGLHRKLTPYKGTMRRGKRKKRSQTLVSRTSPMGTPRKKEIASGLVSISWRLNIFYGHSMGTLLINILLSKICRKRTEPCL